MRVIEMLAVILLAVAGRAVLVYFSPYRQCRWCRPGGLIGGSLPARLAGHQPRPGRRRRCWRCKGSRLTRRLGARHVHKVRLSLRQGWDERGR
jgi:hypothetical protein